MHTHAYPHTHTQSSANAAVMKLDRHQLGLKNINVAISNPPKRGGEAGKEKLLIFRSRRKRRWRREGL